MEMFNQIRRFVEINIFGVCSYLGEKLNIATGKIRLYFIYLSFLTFGSPIIVYFIIAFWMNVKRYIFLGRRNQLRYK